MNGPKPLAGGAVAAIWSRVLGREIHYAGNDLDAGERQSLQHMPDWMVFDSRLTFDFFQRNRFKASEDALARQTELIGHAPRTFKAYAREMADGGPRVPGLPKVPGLLNVPGCRSVR